MKKIEIIKSSREYTDIINNSREKKVNTLVFTIEKIIKVTDME